MIQKELEESFESALITHFSGLVNTTKEEWKNIHEAVSMYIYYAGKNPYVILRNVISGVVRRIMFANKAIIINPLSGIKKPIIRFLGLGYTPKTYMFQPLSRM